MKAPASATVFSAMSSAAACCCIWWMRPASMPARPTRRCVTELEAYEGDLADKIEIVALNKIDAVTPDELKKQKDRLKRAAKKTPLLMSRAPPAKASRKRCGAGRRDRRSARFGPRPKRGAGRALDRRGKTVHACHSRVDIGASRSFKSLKFRHVAREERPLDHVRPASP